MTVTESDLRPMVQDILNAYPSFANWFVNLSPNQQDGMRKAWVRQVATLEPSDVRAATDEILDGRVPLPKNYQFDRLGFELRSWGNIAAARRIEESKSKTLREQARPASDPSVRGVNRRFGQAIKCAASWGAATRAGYVTQSQNEDAMTLIHRHHRQGDVELVWPDVPISEQKSIVDVWRV